MSHDSKLAGKRWRRGRAGRCRRRRRERIGRWDDERSWARCFDAGADGDGGSARTADGSLGFADAAVRRDRPFTELAGEKEVARIGNGMEGAAGEEAQQ